MQTSVTGKKVFRLIASIGLMAMAFAAAAPLSAAKGGQVPFHATFTTVFQSTIAFPLIHVTVQGGGEAQHLGRTETFTTNQTGNLITNHTTATYTLIAANGDRIVLEEETTDELNLPAGTATFAGTYTIESGTGRFFGATGTGTLVGSAQFTGPDSGVGEFTLDGTISSPGSLK